MSRRWKAETFLIATAVAAAPVLGQTYLGVGLHRDCLTVPWSVTHLRSGHRICWIDAPESSARKIASQIAECIDWNFAAPVPPELADVVRKTLAAFGDNVFRTNNDTGPDFPSVAAKIAELTA